MKKAELNKMVEIQYMYSAMEILASAFDMLVNHVHIDEKEVINLFFATETFDYYEIKSPKYMVGMSGRELALEVLSLINFDIKNVDLYYIDFFKTKEYWAMYMITYYKYKSKMSFKEIFKSVSINDVIDMYHPLHEAGFDRFIDEMDDICKNIDNLSVDIVRKRRALGISQKELADMSGVKLRTLQKYETGEKDIRKASYETVERIKKSLGC